ncbi:MAG: LmbE family protein [Myxococcales bacterium]|nr:LmbE family protein [Myxococcales bacterium]
MTVRIDAAQSLFVQPHYDDIALSCGGVVARAAAAGEHPVVVTVFSEGPDEAELTAFARDLHARWGGGPMPWRMRGDEDERAMAVLGAEWLRLPHHEAIYRGYDTWPGIMGPPRAEDLDLVATLAHDVEALWRSTANARVYLPLGIGGHVDHQVCYLAGDRLIAAGAIVAFYEDFPYTTVSGRFQARLAQLGQPFSFDVTEITDWMPQRIEAIRCYASQLSGLFDPDGPFPGPYEMLVRRHAAAIGGGNHRLCEGLFHKTAVA